jgi:DNA-binding transcriptional regulator YiaG
MNDLVKSKRIRDKTTMTAKELKAWMDLVGLSIQELADILGVSDQAVRLWVYDERVISVTNTRIINMFMKYPQLLKEF